MSAMDVLFIGAVMNYDGKVGSLANYIHRDGRWVAPFQYVYEKRPESFTSEGAASVYSVPNLSIAKLVDYLKRRMNLTFQIVWHFDYHKPEVEEALTSRPPTLVAISSTLAFYPQFLNDAVAWINARKAPETKVVVGGKWIYDRFKVLGPGPKLEAVFREVDADYYVINGYGEEALYQLLLAEKAGDTAKAQGLPSVAYRKRAEVGGGVKALYDGEHYRINDVVAEEQTPGLPMIDFANIGEQYLGDEVHVRTASSCPFKCRFCTFPVLQGEHIAFDLDAVMVQLRQLKHMGVKYLYFIDDTFNVPRRRFEELMNRMIRERLDMQWVSFFRSQYADGDLVKKMHEAGCRMVFCGFESGNDRILEAMAKKVTGRQYIDGLEFLDRAGIEVLASYIIGYPGETYETAMDTLELVNHPRVSFSRGSLFYYELNAPVAQLAKEYGLTGVGAEWRHNTMNSHDAARIHLEMIDKLRGVNVPVSDGGGWNVFHQFVRGVSFHDRKVLFREFATIQKEQAKAAGSGVLGQYRASAKTSKRRLRSTAAAPEAVASTTPDMSF